MTTDTTPKDPGVTLGELLAEAEPDHPNPAWGGWYLSAGNLFYPASPHPNGYQYCIRLDPITTPGDVVHWLDHIANKPWGDAAVAGLVRAFADVLDPALTGRDLSWMP
jgi:hypothetical protein